MISTPTDLGFPSAIKDWLPHQVPAIEGLLSSSARIKVLSAPTGSGKTAITTAYARIKNNRFGYITHDTKLEDQYVATFDPMVKDIRGRKWYKCISSYSPTETCEGAPCLSGDFSCKHRFADCEYDTAEREAKNAPWGFLSNYAKWMSTVYHYTHNRPYDNRLGSIDTLIFDEGHKIDNWVTEFTAIDINEQDCEYYLDTQLPTGTDGNFLQHWATLMLPVARTRYANTRDHDELRALESLGKQLSRLSTPGVQWIIDHTINSSIQARALWPDRFLEQYLFMGIADIIVCSATITEKLVNKLGIRENYSYHTVPCVFPPERRKFVYLDVDPPVELTYRSSEAEKQIVRNRVGEIAATYDMHNIAIYTVSHARTKEYTKMFNGNAVVNDLDRFMSANKPSVLLSANIGEGIDFKDNTARIGILPKVPYPSLADPLMLARMKSDGEYYLLITAQAVTQFAGRFCRSVSDWGYVICVDAKIIDLLNEGYFEPWFLESVVYPFVDELPKEPERC